MDVAIFTTLMKYLTDLVKHRGDSDREYFDRFVKPTFEVAETVYEDYLEIFTDLKKLSRSVKDVKTVKDFIQVGPTEMEYKKALEYLVQMKLRGNKNINNSFSGLSHFSRCPSNRKMHCIANLISCTIEPNGDIFTCDMFPNYQKYLISGREDFKRSFESLALPKPCEGYCNGPMLELNLIKNLRLKAMIGMLKRFRNT